MEKHLCLHRINRDKCTFCNGTWDKNYYVVIPEILGSEPNWVEFSSLETSTAKSKREFDTIVDAEWMYLIHTTSSIGISNLEDLEIIALKTERTFGHILWLYVQLWGNRLRLKTTLILSNDVFDNSLQYRESLNKFLSMYLNVDN